MSGGSLRTPKGLKSAPGDLFTTAGFTKFPPRSRNGVGPDRVHIQRLGRRRRGHKRKRLRDLFRAFGVL